MGEFERISAVMNAMAYALTDRGQPDLRLADKLIHEALYPESKRRCPKYQEGSCLHAWPAHCWSAINVRNGERREPICHRTANDGRVPSYVDWEGRTMSAAFVSALSAQSTTSQPGTQDRNAGRSETQSGSSNEGVRG